MSERLSPAEEGRLASFMARPEWPEIRKLLEQLTPGSVAPIEAVMLKVRRELWKDFS